MAISQLANERLPIAEIWVYLSGSPLLALVLTLATYQIGYKIYLRYDRHPVANPVSISIMLIILFLYLFDTPYQTYFEGAKFVHFLLGTATVALAIPIYRGFNNMKGKVMAIFVALLCGTIVSVGSSVLIATWLNASHKIVGSMYAKSVTAPIAMGIAERIHVSPTLTAVFTVVTGIMGSILAPYIFRLMRVKEWWIRGTAIGVGAHGLGITRAFSVNNEAGMFASMAMGLNGVLSAVALPIVIRQIQHII